MSFFDDNINDENIVNDIIPQESINDQLNTNKTTEYKNNINNGCIVYLNISSKRIIVDYKHLFNSTYKTEYIPIGIAYKYDEVQKKTTFLFPNLLCKPDSVHAQDVHGILQKFYLYSKKFIKEMPCAKSLKRLCIEIPTIDDYHRIINDNNIHNVYKDIFGIERYKDYFSKLKKGELFLYDNKQLKFLTIFNGKERIMKPAMFIGTFMIISQIKTYLY